MHVGMSVIFQNPGRNLRLFAAEVRPELQVPATEPVGARAS